MKSSTAKSSIRLIDAISPVTSAFSDNERSKILAEARALAAAPRPAPRAAPLPEPEDVVARWRREANEKIECDRIELERDRREQQQRQQQRERQARQQQRADTTAAWQAHLEARFEAEREFHVKVMAEIVAGLEAKIMKLELELRELKR